MSRIGKLPIKLPEGVTLEVFSQKVKVVGPRGTIERNLVKGITVEKNDLDQYVVLAKGNSKGVHALHGTMRAHIANMVKGVSDGWIKSLEMVGTGYRAESSGNTLILTIGYSHPVKIEAPDGISFKVEKSDITVEGYDKEMVGEIAAKIRAARPPEPYKGKGIKYKDEVIRRKAGKAAKTATSA
jgi:large subunit ribosomal protein L6